MGMTRSGWIMNRLLFNRRRWIIHCIVVAGALPPSSRLCQYCPLIALGSVLTLTMCPNCPELKLLVTQSTLLQTHTKVLSAHFVTKHLLC